MSILITCANLKFLTKLRGDKVDIGITYTFLQVFSGNTDSHNVKVSYLEHPVTARFLRLHVQTWHNHPSLRMDIIGCQECNTIISEVPFTQLEASSYKNGRSRHHACSPQNGHIHSSGGWCPRSSNCKLLSFVCYLFCFLS